MFKCATIIQAPSGRFIFVGRVHENLCNKSFKTLAEAKIAVVDCWMEIGETFPVNEAVLTTKHPQA